jgi:hypothetical protein
MILNENKPFIVIGDVAGRYDEMLELIKALDPKDEYRVICVGDPVDRGPQSKQVVEFFLQNQDRHILIQSNHGLMFIDWVEKYGRYPIDCNFSPFLLNGGYSTLLSYGVTNEDSMVLARTKIPVNHIDFLKNNPMYVRGDKFIITHAPLNPTMPIVDSMTWGPITDLNFAKKFEEERFLWNRSDKINRKLDLFQIHGHMAKKNIYMYRESDKIIGLNVDTSLGNKLSGVLFNPVDCTVLKSASVDYK